MNGMEILKHLSENEIPIPVVVITAHGSIGIAVAAMQAGAKDFLVKPFSAAELVARVRKQIYVRLKPHRRPERDGAHTQSKDDISAA